MTFTLESGTIESTPNVTSIYSRAIDNQSGKTCKVNIKGGSVTVPEAATEGRGIVAGKGMTLNISGGTITGGLHGVDAYSGSNVTITGGTISARIADTGVIKEAYGMRITGTANVTVDGGEITGVKMDDNGYKLDVPNVTLKSGKINGSFYSVTNGTITFTVNDNATITFVNDSATKFLPNTVKLVQNEDGSYSVKAAAAKVAQIGTVTYETLADAIAAAKDGDTVKLLKDCSGNGIQIKTANFADKGLIVDFGGFTYTVGGVLVGSAGTGTNAFQLLQGGKVTFQNGTIVGVSEGTKPAEDTPNWHGAPALVIQNYCDLTLKNMTVTGGDETVYTMSNNHGNVVIENTTINAGKAKGYSYGPYAFDVCGYSSYTGVSVTVKGNSTINGNIEVSRSSSNKNDVKLALDGGTVNGELKIDSSIQSGDATTVTKSANVTLAEPDGYLWNTDGVLVAAVAEVFNADGVSQGTYETLQAAIDAAKRNATVKMLANTRENVTISTPYLTLDLNGFTLNGSTGERKPALTVTARVTVKDSSDPSTGTIMREDTAENSGVSSHYVIDIQSKQDKGWLTFEGGKVENGSGAGGTKGASLVRVGGDSVDKKYPGLVINGGTFTQDNFIVIKVDRGYLNLNGGTLNSANSYAVENWFNANIKGGTVNGAVSSWTYSAGSNSTLTISGGTINGDVTSVNYGNAENRTAKVSITGGTVTGKLDTRSYDTTTSKLTSINDAAKATIKVSGGTFDNAVEERYCAEGYVPVKIDDNTYGVQQQQVLAKIGDTSYYTMDEAFQAVKEGETITLLRDYTTGGEQNSGSKSFAIDLNGHTWTYTGTNTNHAAFEINHSDVTLTVKNGTVVSNSMVGLIPSATSPTGLITYDNAGLVFENVTMTANGHSGIETNGNNTNDTVTLKNSTLNVPNGFGIYFPSSGKLTIDNSTINAKTMGVQVCSGSLSINEGSKITVTGDAVPKTENDGAIQDGAAISIVNRTGYKGLGKIEVTGGTFKANGTNAAIKAYDWANNVATEFTANDKVAVSGGTFSSAVPAGLCAPGYVPTAVDADGNYTVEKVMVAQIGNNKYGTLAEAVTAAKDGDTITLLADIDLDEQIATAKAITIDGQGKYTIKATKKLVGASGKAGMFYRTGGAGTLTFLNVTLDGNGVSKIFLNEGGAGETVFDGVTSINGGGIAYGSGIHISGGGSHATIRNSTLTGSKGTMELNEANYYAANDLWVGGNVYVTVENSTIGTVFVNSAPSATATNGVVHGQLTITGENTKITYLSGEEEAADKLDKFGNNGSLVKIDSGYVETIFDMGSYEISGGTFKTEVKPEWCAEGFIPHDNGDGTYTVKSQYVAMIGDTKYTTLSEALKAAQPGDTVVLVADADEANNFVQISANITLDLAGHSVTALYFYVTGTVKDTAAATDRGIVKAKMYAMFDNAYTPIYDSAKDGYSFFNLGALDSMWDSNNSRALFNLHNPKNGTAEEKLDATEAAKLIYANDKNRRVKVEIDFSWTDDNGPGGQYFIYNETTINNVLSAFPARAFYAQVRGLEDLQASVGTITVQAKFTILDANGYEVYKLLSNPIEIN